MNIIDLMKPVTEIELAEALSDDEHLPVGVIRRLAFQRGILVDKLAAIREAVQKAKPVASYVLISTLEEILK